MDKWLVEKRLQLQEHRGKGMWEVIEKEFKLRYGETQSKASLQMKCKRAKKFVVFSSREVSSSRAYHLGSLVHASGLPMHGNKKQKC